mmetsp:Transcript_28191/g.60049  ORF Transcript_28191/g.60049 Transcript_28191/m.60049 type:complete len:271 (+) Transcript_28191:140-952(+)|eukprot:CAMPEP_0172308628 /NCGR_PEP_ID=MMETSP1058-20130122/9168_1 /TAXON_ID=83371 /ORGANISM="Detonula confervacea, Strain CCMP 353" /LENGTH=270 /DNA_ID=CAMNT_0013021089 /DNA_START=91 /DNA_END=903 /DNA_ORIENTATION=+
MHFQFATSFLAGCAVQAVAHAPAAIVSTAAVSSPKTESPLFTPTNNKKRRLLQKFKKRKERALKAKRQNEQGGESENADVGILSRSDIPRFLQDSDYDYYCPRETCPSALCDCAESGGSLEDCTDQLQDVCRAGNLGDCVFQDYVHVYEEVYCPFVSCVGEGFRESQCDCAFYDLYCSRLAGEECIDALNVATDDTDKKPFFGCDETELSNVCDEAKSCKDRGELQGLPDLGTWKGSVTTGIRNSGERVGGGSVVAGVTLLSMIWLMVNV